MEKDDDLDLDVAKGGASDKKKSGAMKIVVIAVVVLLLVAGVAVGTAMMVTSMIGHQQPPATATATEEAAGKAPAADAHGGHEEDSQGPVTYINVEPAFVVNFEDQTLVRYLQIAVVMTTRDSKAVPEIEHHMPLIQSQLLLLFSSQQVDTLKSRRGKERLQQDALEVVRELLTAQTGKPLIDSVLFTSFVMQ